ncbi:unnamed protein product [Rhizophagus irregularis]|nr:unnamed protein product [Rhizophagus irregularis]
MFLLGLLHSMKRSEQTHHDKTDKKYLTVKYVFDESEICEAAFLHIYSLRRSFRDDTMAITFLPVSNSYIGLYRLYDSSLEIDSEHYENKVKEWHEHITWANQERDYYKKCIENSREQLSKINKKLIIRSGNPNSLEFENHISWDFAEGAHLPYSSQQEGSIYFKSPWKVSIFGICEEAFPQQKNYLIQENENVGKEVQDLSDLVQVVHNSTTGGFNTAQTINNSNGVQKVLFYKWTEFLNKEFTRIPQIQQHHFEISNQKHGVVNVQTKIEGEKVEITILRKNIIPSNVFPNLLVPKELSAERQWYLYEQIREHVTHPDKKDQYCSKPLIPKSCKSIPEN